MMKLHKFDASEAPRYSNLVFASMAAALVNVAPDGPDIAVAATVDDRPAGLAYGAIEDGGIARVRSLFVLPALRRRGIATALLGAIEAEFERLGCSQVQLAYVTGRATTAALERVMEKSGWDAPVPNNLICHLDQRVLQWNGYDSTDEFDREAFQLFQWTDLTPEDREYILRTQAESHWIPDDLVPFQYEDDFEPLNSLGIRYRGFPVGWMITHRVAPDTIRYTCSFVRKDLQRQWRVGMIYREAYQRQYDGGVPFVIFMVPYQHRPMVNFVKRRWGGTCAKLTESRSCSKTLAVRATAGVASGD